MSARWLDLVDPTRAEVEAALPAGADPDIIEDLAAPVGPRTTRPVIEHHGPYVFLALAPIVVVDGHPVPLEVYAVATTERLVTVRKSAGSGRTFDVSSLASAHEGGTSVGELLHRLVDDVADTYLDMLDALYAEIDSLEDRIDDQRPATTRSQLVELRHDLLDDRRTVSATRGAVRRIVDGRIDVGVAELFPTAVERLFADTYDTLVRVTEELDVARELLGGVRDHLQSKIAENQNEVAKKLTVIASLVLVPSFVVGFFGQNFEGEFSREYWTLGFSTAVILLSTIVQLALFRWRRWI